MDQAAGCSNLIENIVGISAPSTKGDANSSIPDESTALIGTNEQLENTTGTAKTKTLNAKTKNLKNASIPAGTRKIERTTAVLPIITRSRKNTMVIDSIKALKKDNGASFEEICEYMGKNYQVDMELWKSDVTKFLKDNVKSGVLEKTNEATGKERYKLAKSAAIVNGPQNLITKEGMQSKAEKRKVDNLSESRKKKKKAENLEAVLESNKNVVPQKVTTTGSVSNTIANKRARNANNESGAEKSKTTRAKAVKVKLVPAPESKTRKRNDHLSTSEMVLDSIKALKKRSGATFDDISKHMEEKYQVSMKVFKSHVNKFLKKGVDEGVLEKSSGVKTGDRYKIKKSEKVKKDSQNSRAKEGKPKLSANKRG